MAVHCSASSLSFIFLFPSGHNFIDTYIPHPPIIMASHQFHLSTEILLFIARYLRPQEQLSLLQILPGLARLFTSSHFASMGDNGNTL
jgi:hypothetical protein